MFASLKIMKYITGLILTIASWFLYGQQHLSESIEFNKKISELLQTGIEKALQHQIPESYDYFNRAYDLCAYQKHDELIPVIVLSQSRLYLLEDKFEEAYACVQKAEKIIVQDSKSSLAGDYFEFLGQYFLHEKKYESALDDFNISEKIRNEIEPGKNWRTYNGMARVYRLMDKQELSEKYSEKASSLSKIQNSRKIIQDMQSELRFDEQSGTIAFLNQENLKSKVALQKARFRNILLIIGLISSLALSSMLFIILRQRSKFNKEIAIKNDIISKSLAEKELLMKEIHHRVKNNLQVISSLLSLQSRSLNDKNASEALLQSQSRVISMSLIHETLYKDGPSSNVELDTYLNKLCTQLFNAYNISGDKISIHLNVHKQPIDVSHLVPLGLIINEIITNALKHAFVGRNKGNIWVSSSSQNNHLSISIKDDGIGTTEPSDEIGFGNKLIEIFSKKLNATIEKKYHQGTEINIIIKNMTEENASFE